MQPIASTDMRHVNTTNEFAADDRQILRRYDYRRVLPRRYLTANKSTADLTTGIQWGQNVDRDTSQLACYLVVSGQLTC